MGRKLRTMNEPGPPFDDPDAFWPLVRAAREAANIGITEMARRLGTTHQRLGRLEEGDEGETRAWLPAQRQAFAIAVAEMTRRPRSELGLGPAPEAAETERQLRDDLELDLAELHGEIDGVRSEVGHLRTRLERVERGTGGSDKPPPGAQQPGPPPKSPRRRR